MITGRPSRFIFASGIFISVLVFAFSTLIPPLPSAQVFVRGRINADDQVNIADVISALDYLFSSAPGPECVKALDINDDGSVDLTDPVFLLNFLFLSGRPIPAPYPDPGADLTPDSLTCPDVILPVPGLSAFLAGPANLTLPTVGTTSQLTVTGRIDGILTDLHTGASGTTYTSSNPAVVMVYRDGLVEAVSTGTATITAKKVTVTSAVKATVTAAGGTAGVKVLVSSDLGMSFMDREFSLFSFHPPLNNIRAQVVKAGAAGTVSYLGTDTVEVRYSPVPDAKGSVNSGSAAKTNFWAAAEAIYGQAFLDGQGLFGYYMPDDAPSAGPQPLAHDASIGGFVAEGIPITATDDAGRYNPYPLMRVTVIEKATGHPLAHTDVVLPIGQETNCINCHLTGGAGAKEGLLNWSQDPDPEAQSKRNILLLHDNLVGTAMADNTPVTCTLCHYSALLDPTNAGPTIEQRSSPTLSSAMHNYHGRQVDAKGVPIFPPAGPQEATCFNCHPSDVAQSSRGMMHTAGIDCQGCHGNMMAVGGGSSLLPGGSIDGTNDGKARRPWKDLPRCESCHTGDANSHLSGSGLVMAPDGMRLLQAYRIGDPSASPLLATNKVFAENTGALYRNSTGHGGVLCENCHGSTHAEWPDADPTSNDNVTPMQIQGHTGVVFECNACHSGNLPRSLTGPHGLHPVGNTGFASDHEGGGGTGRSNCKACHGADLLGSPLSRVSVDRTFNNEFGTKHFPKGTAIGCNSCHGWPYDD